MKQQIMTAPGIVNIQNVPVPKINGDQLLLKIKRIGVCGSDIHVYYGKHPYTSYPVTQGHEVSAEIVQFGENTIGFAVGDKVTVQPQIVCGVCYSCTHGKYNCCDNLKVMGFQDTGMASEYFCVDADKCIKLSPEMDFDSAAMIEPLAVAMHALSRAGSIQELKILVLGAGTIGNLVAQSALARGASRVLITDINDYRLRISGETGIPYTCNSAKEDLNQKYSDTFGSDGADLILECVGSQTTIKQAVDLARKGTDIIIVGVFGMEPKVNLGFVQDHELRVIGTAMYQTVDYLDAIELLTSRKIDLKPLITRHFPLDEYQQAYEYIEAAKGDSMKVIIDI